MGFNLGSLQHVRGQLCHGELGLDAQPSVSELDTSCASWFSFGDLFIRVNRVNKSWHDTRVSARVSVLAVLCLRRKAGFVLVAQEKGLTLTGPQGKPIDRPQVPEGGDVKKKQKKKEKKEKKGLSP